MSFYEFIIGNREIIKILYALIIVLICFVIVFRADRLFKLSMHKGIRYFRNAFLFYGLGFATRYFLGHFFLAHYPLINFVFEYFLIMAGFFLLYSLLWKRIESSEEKYKSSLFNSKISLFYLMTFVITLLDYTWNVYFFMFFSQIILFSFASVISYSNYRKNGRKHKFPQFYFIAMVLSLTAWVLNAISALWLNWHYGVLINVYLLNMLVFLLFLYGVIRVTKF